MPTPSITTIGAGGDEEPASVAAAAAAAATSGPPSAGPVFHFIPAFCLGVVAAVVFQLAWGGLTLTSFFLKLFVYVTFALLCFLAGSFVLLVRKSPLRVSRFDRCRRQSVVQRDFYNQLMVSEQCVSLQWQLEPTDGLLQILKMYTLCIYETSIYPFIYLSCVSFLTSSTLLQLSLLLPLHLPLFFSFSSSFCSPPLPLRPCRLGPSPC